MARKKTAVAADVSKYISNTETRIAEQPERVLFLHAPSEIVFPLRIERASVLDTAIAIMPGAWAQGGDGVTFYVAVRAQGEDLPTYLFSQHLQPHLVETQRGWQPLRLDLTSYRQKNIELILGTEPGPEQDPAYDWAVWREPLVYNPVTDAEWAAARGR